jgi:hypothetical protein
MWREEGRGGLCPVPCPQGEPSASGLFKHMGAHSLSGAWQPQLTHTPWQNRSRVQSTWLWITSRTGAREQHNSWEQTKMAEPNSYLTFMGSKGYRSLWQCDGHTRSMLSGQQDLPWWKWYLWSWLCGRLHFVVLLTTGALPAIVVTNVTRRPSTMETVIMAQGACMTAMEEKGAVTAGNAGRLQWPQPSCCRLHVLTISSIFLWFSFSKLFFLGIWFSHLKFQID